MERISVSSFMLGKINGEGICKDYLAIGHQEIDGSKA
jgi:hypothetical protein